MLKALLQTWPPHHSLPKKRALRFVFGGINPATVIVVDSEGMSQAMYELLRITTPNYKIKEGKIKVTRGSVVVGGYRFNAPSCISGRKRVRKLNVGVVLLASAAPYKTCPKITHSAGVKHSAAAKRKLSSAAAATGPFQVRLLQQVATVPFTNQGAASVMSRV